MPKDLGAEQGDVDGPLQCSLAFGMAAETRMCIAAVQAAGSLPWIGATDDAEPQQLRADHATRPRKSANFQLGGQEKAPCPRPTTRIAEKRRPGRLVVHRRR